MKYTKKDVLNLDAKTIDFCARWIWDNVRRHKLSESITGKTKAQRDYSHAFGHGLEFGFDLLRALKNYNNGSENIADDFSLLDDEIRGLK